MAVSGRRWGLWLTGAVLAVAAGVGVALWRAPDTVDLPVGSSPKPESLPAPMPAPPVLAAAPSAAPAAADAPPPGVSAAQWLALQREFAGRPEELRRLADYFSYADRLQRFRDQRGKVPRADLLPLAQALDAGLDERLRQHELSAGEARLVKMAVLEVLLPDEAQRAAALSSWEDTQRGAAVASTSAAREAEFQRRQSEIVAAWSARPVAQRDRRALERELDALRRASFEPTR